MTDPAVKKLKNWIEIQRKLLEATGNTYKSSLYHQGWWDALAAVEELLDNDLH